MSTSARRRRWTGWTTRTPSLLRPFPALRCEELETRYAPAATFIWTGAGADAKWSTAANWAGNAAPTGIAANQEELSFPAGAARLSNIDDLPGGSIFQKITFGGGGYTLSPATPATTIQLGLATDPGSTVVVVNAGALNDTLAINTTLAAAAGTDQTFSINAGAALTVSAKISGNSGSTLTKDGTGVLTLGNDDSGFSGTIKTNNNAGALVITNALALGTTSAPTIIASGSSLRAQSVAGAINEPVILNGLGVANDGALLNLSGNNTWAGSVTLDSDAALGSASGVLRVTGQISDTSTGHDLYKEGPAEVQLAHANTYRGMTWIDHGILTAQDPLALGAAGTPQSGTYVNETLTQAGQLRLSDPAGVGFTIKDEYLTLNGDAFISNVATPIDSHHGALTNTSGNNTWAGPVTLGDTLHGGSTASFASIGSAAGLNLTISGVVSSPVLPNETLRKIDFGRVILNNANTYTGLTDVIEGYLNARDSQALGPTSTEIQQVTVTGPPGGSFTLTFNGQTTASLPVGATETQVQDALNQLSSIGGAGGYVTVVAISATTYQVVFGDALAGTNVAQMTGTGSGATVAVTTVQNGQPLAWWTQVESNATLELEVEAGNPSYPQTDAQGRDLGDDSITHNLHKLVIGEPIYLSGRGVGNVGALHSITGTNTWAADVRLTGGVNSQVAVGVDQDQRQGHPTPNATYLINDYSLTVSGMVTNDKVRQQASQLQQPATDTSINTYSDTVGDFIDFIKRGDGDLILPVANNYHGKTRIEQGWTTVENDRSLGADYARIRPGSIPPAPIQVAPTFQPGTFVSPGAAVHVKAPFPGTSLTIPENITIAGTGPAHPYALISQKGALMNLDGDNTWSGDIGFVGQAGVGVEEVVPGSPVSELTVTGSTTDGRSSYNFTSPDGSGSAQSFSIDTLGAATGTLHIDYDFYTDSDRLTAYFPPRGPGQVQLIDTGLTTKSRILDLPLANGTGTPPEVVVNEGNAGTVPTIWDLNDVSVVTTGGGLIKFGSKRLTLQGAGSYTGAVDVREGTLRAQNDTALGLSATGTLTTQQTYNTTTTSVESGAILELARGLAGANGGVAAGIQVWNEQLVLNAAGQQVAVAGDASPAPTTYTLSFTDPSGVPGTTAPLPGWASAADIQAALNALPSVRRSEVQTVTLGGAAGGNFTLTFNGQTTPALPRSASAQQVRNALNNLSSIGGVGGSVAVTLAGSVFTVTFGGSLANTNVAQMTAAGNSGTTATVATAQNGQNGSVAVTESVFSGNTRYTVTFGGDLANTNVSPLVAAASGGTTPNVSTVQDGGASQSEVQAIDVANATATFTLIYAGEQTAPLPITATASQVQAALNGLPALSTPGGPGPVTVTRSGNVYTVVFTNGLSTSVSLMTATTAGGAEATISGNPQNAQLVNVNDDNAWRGGVTLNTGSAVSVAADSRLSLLGPIDDAPNPNPLGSDIAKRDVGELVLGGNNTYHGTTFIDEGILTAMSSTAFGAPTGGTVVKNGAQLQLQGSLTIPGEPLTIEGSGAGTPPNSLPNFPTRWFGVGPAPADNGLSGNNLPTSGRVTSVAADPTDSRVFYVATAGGGAWKTRDGGLTWTPLFDNTVDPSAMMDGGSIAVAPSDPNVLYFATGESNGGPIGTPTTQLDGNFAQDNFAGTGVYKSTDYGASWTLLTTPGSGANPIAGMAVTKLVVDPTNKDRIYTATTNVNVLDVSTTALPGVYRFDPANGWYNLTGAQAVSTARQPSPVGTFGQAPYNAPSFDSNGNNTGGVGPPGTVGPDDDYRITFPVGGANGVPLFGWSDLALVKGVLYAALYVPQNVRPFPNPQTGQVPNVPNPNANYPTGVLKGYGQQFFEWDGKAGDPPSQQAILNAVYRTSNPTSNTPSWLIGGGGTDGRNNEFPVGPVLDPQDGVTEAGRNGMIKITGTIDPNPPFYAPDVWASVLQPDWMDQRPPTGFATGVRYYVGEMLDVQRTVTNANGGGGSQGWTTLASDLTFGPNGPFGHSIYGQSAALGFYDNTLLVQDPDPYQISDDPPPGSGLLFNDDIPPIVYLAGKDNAYRSTNGGLNWTALNPDASGASPTTLFHALANDASGRLLVGTDGGIWRWDQYTSKFDDLNGDLAVSLLNSADTLPTGLSQAIVGGRSTGTQQFNNGLAWQTVNAAGGANAATVRYDPKNPANIYAVVDGQLWKTTDGGANWTRLAYVTNPITGFPPTTLATTPLPNPYQPSALDAFPLVVDPVNPSRVLVGGNFLGNDLYESTAGGATGSFINLNAGMSVTSVAAATFQGPYTLDQSFANVADKLSNTYDPDTIYATDGTTLKVTKNHGVSWVSRSPTVTDRTYTVTFTGALSFYDLPQMTATESGGAHVLVGTSINGSQPAGKIAGVREVQTVEVTGNGGTFTLTLYTPDGNSYTTPQLPFNATAAQVQNALDTLAQNFVENEVQSFDVTGALVAGGLAGAFSLTYNGQTTGILSAGATAAQVQAALNGLSTINAGGGSVTVTSQTISNNTTRFFVTFDGGPLANTNVNPIAVNSVPLASSRTTDGPPTTDTVDVYLVPGSTFTLTFVAPNGTSSTTGNLAWNITGPALQGVLNGLNSINGQGNSTVSVSDLTPIPGFPGSSRFTITFNSGTLSTSIQNAFSFAVTGGSGAVVSSNTVEEGGPGHVTVSGGTQTNIGTFTALAVDPSDRDTVYVALSYPNRQGGPLIFRSTDAGQTWTDISGAAGTADVPLPVQTVWSMVVDPRTGTLYVGNDLGVYALDNARTAAPGQFQWSRFGVGMPNVPVRDLQLNQTTNVLTAATHGRGAFQLILSDYQQTPSAPSAALRSVSGTSVWTGNVTLTGPTTFGAEGTQQLQNGIAAASVNILGTISDAVPNAKYQVTKVGLGTVVFSGANTYSGLTDVQQGVLAVNNAHALGGDPAVPTDTGLPTVVENGAALEMRSDLQLEPVTINGNGFLFNGHFTGALRNVSNINTYTGTLTLNTDATVGADTGTTLIIGTSPTLLGAGTVTGAHNLVKELTGTLVLEDANTYGAGPFAVSTDPLNRTFAGGTVVVQGAVNVQHAQGLGSGTTTTVLDGAQLQIANAATGPLAGQPVTVTNQTLVLSGTGINKTGALLNTGGSNTWAGPVTLTINPNFAPGTNPGSQVSVGVTNAADNVTISGVIGQPTGAQFLASMGLIKIGPGRLTFANDNTYTGVTNVTAGAVRVQRNGALGQAISPEVQIINVSGLDPLGKYSLTFNGSTTGFLSSQATAAQVQTALNLLPSVVAAGTVRVSETPNLTGKVLTVTFQPFSGTGADVPQITANPSRVSVTIATAQQGGLGTVVSPGAALEFDGDPTTVGASISVPEALTIGGDGLTGTTTGALHNVTGNNTATGTVTLASDTTIGVDPATQLTVTGTVQDPTPTPVPVARLRKAGAGTLVFPNANTYGGKTVVDQGVLNIRNAAALGALRNEIQNVTVNPTGTSGTFTLTFKGQTTAPIPFNATAAQVQDALNRLTTVGLPEVQLVQIGGATTGTFTLTFNGQTTGPLSATATAAQVQAALNALPTIGGVGGSVAVTQNGPTYTVTFGGTLWGSNQPQMTLAGSGGTGGAVTTTQDGTPGVTVTQSGPPSNVVYAVTFVNHLGNSNQPQMTVATSGPVTANVVTALDGSEGTVVNTGATLQLQGSLTMNQEYVTINGPGFNNMGALDVAAGGSPTWAVLPLTLGSNSSIGVDAGGDNLTFTAPITDNGSAFGVEKVGPGVVTYQAAGDNKYTGTTKVDAGTLALNEQNGGRAVLGPLVVGDGVGAAGSAVVKELQSAQINSPTTPVTVNSDGTFDLNGKVDGVGALTVNDGLVTTAGSGGGGTAQLIPTGITMTGGTINIATAGDLVALAPGAGGVTATSDAAGPAAIIGPGAFGLFGAATRTFTVNDGPQAVDLDVQAVVVDFTGFGSPEGLVKAGNGRMRLGAAETYTGLTTVNAGDLQVDGSVANVALAGGSLSGDGTAGTVDNGAGTGPAVGTVAPGDNGVPATAIGTLTTGAETWGAGTTFSVDLSHTSGGAPVAGTDNDLLNVNGAINLNGATLTGTYGAGIQLGDSFTIIQASGGVVGKFAEPFGANVAFIQGQKFTVTYNPNSVVLTKIKASATITITSSANPSTLGQSVTFTATVTPEPGASVGAIPPTDTLTFTLDGVTYPAQPVGTSGQVTFDPQAATGGPLSAGPHAVHVDFSGDANSFAAGSADFTQTVEQPAIGPATATPPAISPAASPGSQDSTVISATVGNERSATNWTITIQNGATTVRTFTGNNNGSTGNSFLISQAWDGRDAGGNVVADGVYTAIVSFQDQFGNTGSTAVNVTVDDSAPGATPVSTQFPIIDPNPNPTVPQGTVLSATVADATLAGWTVTITNAAGAVVRTFGGTGTAVNVSWDGKDGGGNQVPDGVYNVSLTVTDQAGNSTTPPGVQVVVLTQPPAITITSNNPSAIGDPITFVATVTVPAFVPKAYADLLLGQPVHFFNGSTDLGSGAIVFNGQYQAAVTVPSFQPGTYPNIVATFAGSQNYLPSTSQPYTQVVRPGLIVTAANLTKVYGDPLPVLVYSVSGLQDGDTADSVLSGSLATDATQGSPVGAYAITQGTLQASPKYKLIFTPGTLTVTPATLTVTVPSVTKVYGAAMPPITFTVSGLTNGDSQAAVLTGAPATAATQSSGVGTYPITPGSLTLTSPNYALAFNGGSVTVTPAPLTITIDNATRLFNTQNPAFTSSVQGLVNGDTLAVIQGLDLQTPATVDSPPGQYPITAGNPTSPNYAITVVPGTLTVNTLRPASVTSIPADIAVGSGAGTPGQVVVVPPQGLHLLQAAVSHFDPQIPFVPGFTGGIRVAAADFNGDGVSDIVLATGPGIETLVEVVDGKTRQTMFAIDPFAGFTGGVFVSAGDLTGDGAPDLIISPETGGGPRVRIFDGANNFAQIADFFGINDPNFRGGARAAIGDVNHDGFGDVVVSAGFGGGPRIAVFSGKKVLAEGNTPGLTSDQTETWKLTGDFIAFSPGLRNGVYIAAGDVDGDGFADIIAGAGPGGGPEVQVISGRDILAGTKTIAADFFAGDVNNRGGIRVTAKDIDGDKQADVVVGPGDGGGALLSGYRGAVIMGAPNAPAPDFSFAPFDSDVTNGVFVG